MGRGCRGMAEEELVLGMGVGLEGGKALRMYRSDIL